MIISRKIAFWLFLLMSATACAQPIIPPANLFRDPKFIREFVGSYGFHSEVEPKVNADEQALLVVVREKFEAGEFAEAEHDILRFVQEVETPQDRKKPPGEISPAMIFVLGNLYFQADRGEDARRAFLEAIRRFPKFRRAHTNLAYLYISKNKFEEALPMLQKAVELGENSARVYGLLGYCHLLKKNALAAENAYRQAYLLDPESRDWKLGLAQALIAQERYPEAANLVGSLIEDNPNDKQLWLQQTSAYLAMDRKDEATVNLESLRLKGLADEANLNLLGNLYMDRNEPQLALQAYLGSLEATKKLNIATALKSARILMDFGAPEKAEVYVSRVREIAGPELPSDDRTNLLLTEARIARAKKDPKREGAILAELAQADPANAEVLLELAKHYDLQAREEGDEEKRASFVADARVNYQLAIAMPPVAYQANLGYAQMLVREQRFSEALPRLQAALDLKKSESLEQYTSRVRRAADRHEVRSEKNEDDL